MGLRAKDIRVGVDDSNVEDGCHSFDPISDQVFDMKALDRYLSLELEPGDIVEGFFKAGLRDGACKIVSSRTNVEEIVGEYRGGTLEGKA